MISFNTEFYGRRELCIFFTPATTAIRLYIILFEVDYQSSWNKGIEQANYTATETIQNNTVLEPWNLNLYICT